MFVIVQKIIIKQDHFEVDNLCSQEHASLPGCARLRLGPDESWQFCRITHFFGLSIAVVLDVLADHGGQVFDNVVVIVVVVKVVSDL